MNAQPPEVRAHMERISNSALFAESERLRRFLRFTVEAKLRGEQERLKEYVLGREVFERFSIGKTATTRAWTQSCV